MILILAQCKGIIMNINFDLYKTFCAVAKCGSISAAANELFVSQSAVSQSVKQLETALGGKLFNRGARGVTLTAEGKAVYEYAKSAYELLNNAEKAFQNMKDMNSGEIRIGASDTICSLFLLDKLKTYNEQYPDINIKLYSGTSNELVDKLKDGDIDIAFANLPITQTDGISIREIMQISDCFVASKKFASLAHKTVTLNELSVYPLLMLDKKSSSRRGIDEFLASKDITLTPCVELGSDDLLIECAKIGLGISLVIEQTAKKYIESGELYKLQLAQPLPKRSIGLVTLNNQLSVAAEHFIDLL